MFDVIRDRVWLGVGRYEALLYSRHYTYNDEVCEARIGKRSLKSLADKQTTTFNAKARNLNIPWREQRVRARRINTDSQNDSDSDADGFSADGAANSSPSGRPPKTKTQLTAGETSKPKRGRLRTVLKAANAAPP